VGAGMGTLMGKFAKSSIDKAVEAISKYGGTALKTSLSKDTEKELQDALHGGETVAQ
jgi:uncharacterized membrane protein